MIVHHHSVELYFLMDGAERKQERLCLMHLTNYLCQVFFDLNHVFLEVLAHLFSLCSASFYRAYFLNKVSKLDFDVSLISDIDLESNVFNWVRLEDVVLLLADHEHRKTDLEQDFLHVWRKHVSCVPVHQGLRNELDG